MDKNDVGKGGNGHDRKEGKKEDEGKGSEGKKEDMSGDKSEKREDFIESENENEKEKKVKIPLYTFDDLWYACRQGDIEKLKEMLPHCLDLLEQQSAEVIYFDIIFLSFLFSFFYVDVFVFFIFFSLA
jgi:hypothetical protein